MTARRRRPRGRGRGAEGDGSRPEAWDTPAVAVEAREPAPLIRRAGAPGRASGPAHASRRAGSDEGQDRGMSQAAGFSAE